MQITSEKKTAAATKTLNALRQCVSGNQTSDVVNEDNMITQQIAFGYNRTNAFRIESICNHD